jgi:hypothetical protein
VLRQWLIIALVLIVGLQGTTLSFAADAPHTLQTAPDARHAVMAHTGQGDCCPHHCPHTLHDSCLTHCTGAVALLAVLPTFAFNTLGGSSDPLIVLSRPNEQSRPVLRPPIA